MPVNKVVFGAVAIMDISDSTVTPETLAEGETAYDKAGNKITGTMKSAENLTVPLDAQEAKLTALLSSLDGKAAGGGGAEKDNLDAFLMDTLTDINSDATSVTSYGSYGRSLLRTVDLPKCTSIGGYAFRGCGNLTNVDAPLTTRIDTYAFYGCYKLTDINMPDVTTLGTYAFYKCDLRDVNFSDVNGIPQNAFFQNENLQRADFGKASKINQSAFANCGKLDTLILRLTTGICTLGTAAASLQNTPIADGTGYVYVPASLIGTYKTATNWVNYANQFRAIEDYPEITGG